MLSEPSYLAARMVASTIESHFAMHLNEARKMGKRNLAAQPPIHIIEAIIDAAFWASLQREEGHSPKISIALVHPDQADRPLSFGRKLRLTPHNLNKLSPAVEKPGIHLAVWNEGDDVYIWGTTHGIPHICFVLEVIEPGLVVIKHSRVDGFGKFVNIAILKGDKIKIVDESNSNTSGEFPDLMASLMGMPLPSYLSNSVNVWVELAASMRAHQRGGIVLVVPNNSDAWRKSIVKPISYPVEPPYTVVKELVEQDHSHRNKLEWQERLLQGIEIIGGFTAVDGATIVTQDHQLLAFGAKIARATDNTIEEIVVTEPTIDSTACRMHPAQNGGTRHLAAAQFVYDQHDAIALVASQDGNFTIFAWNKKLEMVHAHRIDILLL